MEVQTNDMLEFLGVLNRFLDGLAECKSLSTVASGEDIVSTSSETSLLNGDDLDLDESFIFLKLRNALQEIVHELKKCRGNLSETSKSFVDAVSKDEEDNEAVSCSHESLSDKFGDIALSIARELLHFHKSASNKLTPLIQCNLPEDDKDKDNVITAWRTISEANKSLRLNYGLERKDLQQILSWLHGKDLSESSRRHLNSKVDTLIQEYKLRLSHVPLDDIDIPAPFCQFPDGLEDVLKDCCSDVECLAAGSQETPQTREDYESLILREIPQTRLQIANDHFDIASPGKAFENSRLKMHAARNLAIGHAKSLNIDATKEQLELFSLKLLATTCISVSHFACRTAVVMAYGKKNLVKVKPCPTKADCEPAVIKERGGILVIRVPTIWWLAEDNELFAAVRETVAQGAPIAIVNACYELGFDLYASIDNKDEPLPIVHVELASNPGVDKDGPFMSSVVLSSRNLRRQFTKATSKLLNWKQMPFALRSLTQLEKISSSAEHLHHDSEEDSKARQNKEGTKPTPHSNADAKASETAEVKDSDAFPVPPPRPNHFAKKHKRSRSQSLCKSVIITGTNDQPQREDDSWFKSPPTYLSRSLSSIPIAKPPAAVASFQELQEVIDFLSGSSTSSVGIGATGDDKSAEKSGSKNSRCKREARKRKSKQKKKAQLAAANQSEKQPSEKGDAPCQVGVVADSGIGSNASMQSAGSETTTVSNSPCDLSVADAEVQSRHPATVEEVTQTSNNLQNETLQEPIGDSQMLEGSKTDAPFSNHGRIVENIPESLPLKIADSQLASLPPGQATSAAVALDRDRDIHHSSSDSQLKALNLGSQESLYYSAWSLDDSQFDKATHVEGDHFASRALPAALNEVFYSETTTSSTFVKSSGQISVPGEEWPNDLSDKLASIWLNKELSTEEHFKPDIWSSSCEPAQVGSGPLRGSAQSIPASWRKEPGQIAEALPPRLNQRSSSFRYPSHPPGFSGHRLSCSHEQLPWNHENVKRSLPVAHPMPKKQMSLSLQECPLPRQEQQKYEEQFVQDASMWPSLEATGLSTTTGSLPGGLMSNASLPHCDYRWHSSEQFQSQQHVVERVTSSTSGWPANPSIQRNRSLDGMFGAHSSHTAYGMGIQPTSNSPEDHENEQLKLKGSVWTP